jgi:hypothetical protein
MLIRGEISTQVKGNGSINGRGLRHLKLSSQERVALAADVATGAKHVDLSHGQLCSVFEVTPPALRAELKARAAANGTGNGEQVKQFVEMWIGFSYVERVQALQDIGVAEVWDVLANVVG